MAAPYDAPAPEKLPPRYREAAGLLLDVDPSMRKGFTMRATRLDGTSLALKQLFAALATQPPPHPRGRVSHGRDEVGVVRTHVAQLHSALAIPTTPEARCSRASDITAPTTSSARIPSGGAASAWRCAHSTTLSRPAAVGAASVPRRPLELAKALEALGVRVWFDAVAIQPGTSQSLQMDAGLRKARASIAVLTAAYLAAASGLSGSSGRS